MAKAILEGSMYIDRKCSCPAERKQSYVLWPYPPNIWQSSTQQQSLPQNWWSGDYRHAFLEISRGVSYPHIFRPWHRSTVAEYVEPFLRWTHCVDCAFCSENRCIGSTRHSSAVFSRSTHSWLSGKGVASAGGILYFCLSSMVRNVEWGGCGLKPRICLRCFPIFL